MESKKMKTMNSLSGGKSSSFIAVNYPADFEVFALVRIESHQTIKDKKLIQRIEDKIQQPFVATPEQDNIVTIMFDLEQKIGRNIHWITGKTFEQVIKEKANYLPNVMTRYCTTRLKMFPMFDFWQKNINEICDMRIGFRSGEERRMNNVLDRCVDGVETTKMIVGKHKNGNNKWKEIAWRKPTFPLIENMIDSKMIHNFWQKNDDVRFKKGYYNNCTGCFHRSPMFLSKMNQEHHEKISWFASMEERTGNQFKKELSMKSIQEFNPQIEIDWNDFGDDSCDSGFCGL